MPNLKAGTCRAVLAQALHLYSDEAAFLGCDVYKGGAVRPAELMRSG